MSRTEELIRQAQTGDRNASEQLVTENSGLIWSVARRFMGRGAEADDLYQLGCLGFLKAVDGFDLQYGTQFSTYAVPKIAGEIRRFLRDDGAVKVSRSLQEQAMTIKTARNPSNYKALSNFCDIAPDRVYAGGNRTGGKCHSRHRIYPAGVRRRGVFS